jgi:hypothetical protein
MALVETLAYVADHLSYRQDAVGTESYLGTARSRISLRRHARLVDYTVKEGSNARVWVHVNVKQAVQINKVAKVFPRLAGLPPAVPPQSAQPDALVQSSDVIFATLESRICYPDLNELQFYTWEDANCCLVPGATQAILAARYEHLGVGDVLVFEEVRGPNTGAKEDADPRHRWAVRLTSVRNLVDPLNNQQLTAIAWDPADALPFPLCLSSTTDADHGAKPQANVSVARGNIIAADHGLYLYQPESLGEVPPAPPAPVGQAEGYCCDAPPQLTPRSRYYPSLKQSPLTFARGYDPKAPASTLTAPPGPDDHPQAQIEVKDNLGQPWTLESDLLESKELDKVYVVEIERDGTVSLRFGDDRNGAAPAKGESFTAKYRIGNGRAGNIGPDILAHIESSDTNIRFIRNPLAAGGGIDPDSMEDIRQLAPFAFLTQLRAVTEDDYAHAAMRDPRIREARGTFRWTGSWRTMFVSIDPVAGQPISQLISDTRSRLDLFRMAGTDLEVEPAILVGLKFELHVCILDDYFQSDVCQAILRLLTAGDTCDGRPGILNPENFTFGQTIYLSPILAAVQAVPGVASVRAIAFQRLDDPSSDGTDVGYLTMHRLEIARVDNDPSRPDLGILILHLDGGK